MKRHSWVLVLGALIAARSAATAQEVPDIIIEAPEVEVGETAATDEIELGNVVLTASKSKTTIQEAPAIVTVITAKEIDDHGMRELGDVLNRIPGWTLYGAEHHQFPFPTIRGTIQAALLLHDGVSAHDPFGSAPEAGRVVPMELYKRMEVITGPGGVLWGANSYLGIINMITKDVEDIHGIEARAGYGDGPGSQQDFKGYVLYGHAFGKDKKLKVVAHGSFERFQGPKWSMPAHIFSTPLPQPNSLYQYGPRRDSNYPTSQWFQTNGKISYGPVSAYWHVPFLFNKYHGLGFPANVPQADPPGDPAIMTGAGFDCAPGSSPELDGECYDPLKRGRKNHLNWYDRYGILEYRGAVNDNKIQINAKGYFYNFKKEFVEIHVLPGSSLLPGGLSFQTDASAYRSGAQADVNIAVGKKVNLITGGEAFYEWMPPSIARFNGPNNLNQLPLPCPREADPNNPSSPRIVADYDPVTGARLPGANGCPVVFAYGADRVVLAGFLNAQAKPLPKLILDGGARVQIAPGGDTLPNQDTGKLTSDVVNRHRRGYPAQLLLSGAAVWNFMPDYHAKVNYAEGFRPPVFNNTDPNGEAVEIGGSPLLRVERSQSVQTEINARVLRNRRSVRDLSFRADYAFTRLVDFIQLTNGARYANSGIRNIHSGEVLAKLNLVGGHNMELGYTYLKTIMAEKGVFRAMPEHQFLLATQIDTGKWLDLNGALRVLGAFEDPNRLVDLTLYNTTGVPSALIVQPTDLVWDRLPPRAEIQLGFRIKNVMKGLTIKGDMYNLLDNAGYGGDYFYDSTPRLEILPQPTERFRFFAYAQYNY